MAQDAEAKILQSYILTFLHRVGEKEGEIV